jgi:predicted MFS family arabinose efflux permease
VASVLGVPAGLELARLGGWRAPFFTVAALGAVVAAAAMALLPPQRAHLAADRRGAPMPFRELLSRPVVVLALTGTAVAVIANFALIPNLSAYFQFNRGYPRDELGLLYMIGGAISFGTMRIAGYVTDRYGAPVVTVGGSIAFIGVLLAGFIYPTPAFPVLAIFVCFMVTMGFRFVPLQALSSRVPDPRERARFMSAQSAVQHLASAIGAMIGAQILTEQARGALAGIDDLAWFAVATSIALPPILYAVDRLVRARSAAAPAVDEAGAQGATRVVR